MRLNRGINLWTGAMPHWGQKMTDRERERGYTDEQRKAALALPHMQAPSPWLTVVSDPWPNKVQSQRDKKSG